MRYAIYSAQAVSGACCPRIFLLGALSIKPFGAGPNQGLWEDIMHALRQAVRVKAGRTPDPTLAIIDSQSVKTVQKGGSEDLMAASR